MPTRNQIEKENWRLAENLSKELIQRWDLYARQLDDGRYVCVYRGFSVNLMYAHLKGDLTLGAYLLDKDNQARFTVLDVDDEDGFSRLKQASEGLQEEGLRSYLEASRRGGHLWFFFEEKIPGELARGFGRWVEKHFELRAEVFPKQDSHGQGPGSLIRLPFGIHQKTGQRYEFEGLGDLRHQIAALGVPDKIPLEYVKTHQFKERKRQFRTPEGLKSVPIAEFIGQFVELKPTASGFIGLCPFHDDNVPSFGINAEGNYWHCFAGCGGGDIVSFWMRWRGLNYRQAAEELKNMKKIDPGSSTPVT